MMRDKTIWSMLSGGAASPGTNYKLSGVRCNFSGADKKRFERLPLKDYPGATFIGQNGGITKETIGGEYIALENCRLQ